MASYHCLVSWGEGVVRVENLHLQIYKVLNDSVGVCPKQLQLLLILGNYTELGMEGLRFVGETLPIELLPELWEEKWAERGCKYKCLKI